MTTNGYKECYEAVLSGQRVTLAVAAYASTDYYSKPIQGLANGVYECWLQTEGLDRPIPFFKLINPELEQAMPVPRDLG
jgi:hypothetical protein